MVVRWLIQAKIYENYSSEREIKARRVKSQEVKGYNSKIVSAGKDWREEDLQLDQFYQGLVLQSLYEPVLMESGQPSTKHHVGPLNHVSNKTYF